MGDLKMPIIFGVGVKKLSFKSLRKSEFIKRLPKNVRKAIRNGNNQDLLDYFQILLLQDEITNQDSFAAEFLESLVLAKQLTPQQRAAFFD